MVSRALTSHCNDVLLVTCATAGACRRGRSGWSPLSIRSLPFHLVADDRAALEDQITAGTLRPRHRRRATVLLMSDDGTAIEDIAHMTGLSTNSISSLRSRYRRYGLTGLFAPAKPHGNRRYGPEINDAILAIAATPPPDGARWWTAKLIAEYLPNVAVKHVHKVIKSASVDLRAGRLLRYRY